MKKQEFNRYFAGLIAGLCKNNKTGNKILRKAIVPALVLAGWDRVAKADTINVDYTGHFQYFTVQTTGLYDITAFGAQGGSGYIGTGGKGAKIGGEFNLTAGQVLKIAVGGAGGGSGSFYCAGGGGGGSFVTLFDSTPLIVAGGGGGGNSSPWFRNNGGAGRTDHFGSNGGGGGSSFYGGGGGGFTSSGGSGDWSTGGGGSDFGSGLAGGSGFWVAGNGGFGGGGGGSYTGGGGGGFDGGGGGNVDWSGGGGGSYVNTNGVTLFAVAGFNSGNGAVDIAWAWSGGGLVDGVVAVPEPSAASLFGVGLAVVGVGFAVRRRQSRLAERTS